MTIDIARAETNAVAALGNSSDALARLGQWVEAARHAHQLVAPLVDTAFVPEAYKPKVDPRATPAQKEEARAVAVANATAAVLQGITLGLDPLTALQQIYIVHGRPGMYAKLMVALVQAHGHEVWTEDLTDTRAVVCGRRKGTDYVDRVVVTMDQARKAGWTSNQNYAKTPQDMLYARAAGRVCNHIASDVLMGIASVEEIQDTVQASAEVGNGHRTVEAPTRRRQAMRAKNAAEKAAGASEEPPLEEEEPSPVRRPNRLRAALNESLLRAADDLSDDEFVEIGPELAQVIAENTPTITAAQQRKMHALLRENDMGEREAGLMYVTTIVGRPVESTKELTVEEAAKVIDALDSPVENPNIEPTLDLEP